MMCTKRLVVVISALALSASACSSATADEGPDQRPAGASNTTSLEQAAGIGPAGSGPAPATVTLGLLLDVDSFDPLGSLGDSGALQAFRFVYDTMVRVDRDGKVVPGIAESWTTEGTSTTFQIRSGLTCSDGTALDAAAVGASIRTLGTEGGMGGAGVFGPGGLKEVRVDEGANTVTIETGALYNEMLPAMTSSSHIVCPAGLVDREALRRTPQGSGPYELISSQPGTYLLKRRDAYTNLPAGTAITDLPQTVTLSVIGDDATAADLLAQNRVQIIATQSSISSFLASDPTLVAVPAAGWGTNAVTFMQREQSATADPQLRRGMAMLLDSVEGSAAETGGTGISRRTMFTPNLACYSEDLAKAAPAYDPAAAAALLDSAGYVVGADGFRTRPDGTPLVIRVVGNNFQGMAPQYIADALEAGGFHVDLFVGTYDESIAKLLSDNFDVGMYPYVSSDPSLSSWPNQIGTSAVANFSRISNLEFDAYAAAALAADVDSEQRCSSWHEAERAALSAADIVPFSQPVKHWFGNGVTFDATYFTVDPFSIRTA
ncbi:MAG: ABC transporter substrate-binding protein [Microthrixaceae bacterium]|nr:hypothetical protein [Microthrixaceae bacterium]MCO5313998.1 ABC transporter substrate-binding protein [Microthrixaceae bacterium]HPB45702.1 ABC transporter substrate-binding protein [Microthrixaceae bacterium]